MKGPAEDDIRHSHASKTELFVPVASEAGDLAATSSSGQAALRTSSFSLAEKFQQFLNKTELEETKTVKKKSVLDEFREEKQAVDGESPKTSFFAKLQKAEEFSKAHLSSAIVKDAYGSFDETKKKKSDGVKKVTFTEAEKGERFGSPRKVLKITSHVRAPNNPKSNEKGDE